MNLFQKAFAGVGAVGILLSPLAAIAQFSPSQYLGVHKYTDSATSKTYVYIPEVVAGAPVSGFTSEKAPTSRVLTLNNCGWGSFTKSATSPPTNITGANWAGKTTGAAPTCVKDPAPATTYTTSNPAATGTIVDDGTKIWVKGGTGPGSVTLGITASSAITTKANACGFLRVAVSTSRPLTTFSIGSTNYTLASLPTAPAPMICRKVGTSSFTYGPL